MLMRAFAHVSIKRHWPVYVLALLAFTAYLPVLVWPHWGLFSDSDQILMVNRLFWSNPWHHMDFYHLAWRPGNQLLDLLVYRLFPEQPFWFYLLKACLFAGTVTLTYAMAWLLTRTVWISFLTALFWFLFTGTYEVIYTLDKFEVIIAFCMAAMLTLYWWTDDQLRLGIRLTRWQWGWRTLGMVFFITYSLFTKETPQIMMLPAIAIPLGRWLLTDCKGQTSRLRWSMVFGAAVMVGVVAYKLFFYLTGGGTVTPYATLQFTPQHLVQAWTQYQTISPDFIILNIVCLLSSGFFVWRDWVSESRRLRLSPPLVWSVVLTLTNSAGFVILLNFRFIIAYVWFPFLVLLLPVSAYYVFRWQQTLWFLGRHRAPLLAAMIGIIYAALLPATLVRAQCQFAMDSLKDRLTQAFIIYQRQHQLHPMVIGLPWTDPGRAEIGERLAFFTFDRRHHDRHPHFPRMTDPFYFFNVVRYDPNVSGMAEPFQFEITRQGTMYRTPDSLTQPGLTMISYYAKRRDFSDVTFLWVQRPLPIGAFFVVPYGDSVMRTVPYRFAAEHGYPAQDRLLQFPQLALKERFKVETPIWIPFQPPAHMGWDVYQATDAPPIAWNLASDGSFFNNSQMAYPAGKWFLNVQGQWGAQNTHLTLTCPGTSFSLRLTAHPNLQTGAVQLSIPLTCPMPAKPTHPSYQLIQISGTPNAYHTLFQIKSVQLVPFTHGG